MLPGLNIGNYNVAANDPVSRGLDPTITALIGVTPLPNNFTTGDGLNIAGYTFSPIQREQQQDAVVKIDHVINSQHSVYGRYAQGHQNTIGDNVNGGLARFPDTPRIVDTFRNPKNLATNWRWTPTSRITNEFVFGISRFAFDFANPDPSFPDVPPFILNDVTDPFNNELGNIRRFSTYQFVDNATYVRGAHTFKGGINFRYQQHVDTRGSVAGMNVQPTVNFSTTINTVDLTAFSIPTDINTSSDRPRLQRTINNLLGRIGQVNRGFVAAGDQYAPPGTEFNFDARYGEYDFYGQDNWRVRPNLTLDFGLRWEVKRSPRSSGNPILRPEEPFVVGSNPSSALKWAEGELFDSDLNNFGPSIGIAWDPFSSGKTSVRANFRIAYDRMNTFVVSSTIYQSEPGLTLGVINTQFGQNGGRLRDGLPAIAPPAGVTPTQLRQPASFSTNTFHVIDPNWQAPKTYQWSLSRAPGTRRRGGGGGVRQVEDVHAAGQRAVAGEGRAAGDHRGGEPIHVGPVLLHHPAPQRRRSGSVAVVAEELHGRSVAEAPRGGKRRLTGRTASTCPSETTSLSPSTTLNAVWSSTAYAGPAIVRPSPRPRPSCSPPSRRGSGAGRSRSPRARASGLAAGGRNSMNASPTLGVITMLPALSPPQTVSVSEGRDRQPGLAHPVAQVQRIAATDQRRSASLTRDPHRLVEARERGELEDPHGFPAELDHGGARLLPADEAPGALARSRHGVTVPRGRYGERPVLLDGLAQQVDQRIADAGVPDAAGREQKSHPPYSARRSAVGGVVAWPHDIGRGARR